MNNKKIYGALVLILAFAVVVFVVIAGRASKESAEQTPEQTPEQALEQSYAPETSELNPVEKANPFKNIKTNPFE